jgi:hypothetical protein
MATSTSALTRETFAEFNVIMQVNAGTGTTTSTVWDFASTSAVLPQIPYGPEGPIYAIEITAAEWYNISPGIQPSITVWGLAAGQQTDVVNVLNQTLAPASAIGAVFASVLNLENQAIIVDVDSETNVGVSAPFTTDVLLPFSGFISTTNLVIDTGAVNINGTSEELLGVTSYALEMDGHFKMFTGTSGGGVTSFDLSGAALTIPASLLNTLLLGPMQGAPEVQASYLVDFRDEEGNGFLTLSTAVTAFSCHWQGTGASQTDAYMSFAIKVFCRYKKISQKELLALTLKYADLA